MRRRKPGKNGRYDKARAQKEFLAALEADPGLSDSMAAARSGRTEQAAVRWKKDPDFYQRYARIKQLASGGSPPDPGPFVEWRRKYVNVRTQNPYTGKWSQVGETYPFMVPFVESLDNPSHNRVLALLPVRHGKTTVIEHLVVWYLCRNPDARVILVCRTFEHAEERLYKIRQMLESEEMYPELHERWGLWIGKPDSAVTTRAWQARKFYVRGATGTQRSPSVRGYGISSSTYGARADLIVLDDVDDPDTEIAARNKILRTINASIINRLDEGGKMVIIGTRCGPGDIYGPLLESPMYDRHVARAIQDDGTALCPEMYSIEELEAFRQETDHIDPSLFLMSYQNEVSSPLDQMFTQEMLDKAKGDYGVGECPDNWEKTIILDPAESGTASVVTLAHKGLEIRILDVTAHRAPGWGGIFDMLQQALDRHKPQKCVIEENWAGKLLAQFPAIEKMLYDHGLSVTYFRTGSNKNDPRFGMGLVKARFDLGMLTYAWADLEAQRTMRPLLNELLTWRPTGRSTKEHHWDRTMALWIGTNLICTGQWTRFGHRPVAYDPLVMRRPFMLKQRQRQVMGATKQHVEDQYREEMARIGVTSTQHH